MARHEVPAGGIAEGDGVSKMGSNQIADDEFSRDVSPTWLGKVAQGSFLINGYLPATVPVTALTKMSSM